MFTLHAAYTAWLGEMDCGGLRQLCPRFSSCCHPPSDHFSLLNRLRSPYYVRSFIPRSIHITAVPRSVGEYVSTVATFNIRQLGREIRSVSQGVFWQSPVGVPTRRVDAPIRSIVFLKPCAIEKLVETRLRFELQTLLFSSNRIKSSPPLYSFLRETPCGT